MKRILFLLTFLFAISGSVVFASTTDGTIDSTNKYVWGEKTGWLNLGTTGGNIHVTDSVLTGYIWSENYGWINLAPTGSGVINNSEGTLSGSAWGENLGYIGFSGVTINSSGVFLGTASGTVAGRISFDCTNCSVVTDWRPASTRGSSGSTQTITVGGGGSGGVGGYTPSSNASFIINGNASFALSPLVTLSFTPPQNTTKVVISNYEDFRDAVTESIVPTRVWSICSSTVDRTQDCVQGEYTIYVRFYDAANALLGTLRRSILYTPNAILENIRTNPQSTLQKITESVRSFLARLVQPLIPGNVPALPPTDIAVSLPQRETPFVFRMSNVLLSQTSINKFVFAPLPKEIQNLAQKFPSIQSIFRDIGVKRQTDLSKLGTATFRVPGLTQSSGIVASSLSSGNITPLTDIPIAQLPFIAKQQLPTEIVFARNENEKIDFDIKVQLNEQGRLEKRIQTIVGKTITLAVKTEIGAKHVKGYLVLRPRAKVGVEEKNVENKMLGREFSLEQLASPIFAIPEFAETVKPARYIPITDEDLENGKVIAFGAGDNIEERLSLLEFEYTDPDDDGIYTAEIAVPRVAGEYDIITIIEYTDPDLGAREIRLTAVIDPEGYVYEKIAGKETRIPGAIISLYALNRETKQYELWQAEEYAQENPQITDIRGTYAFLVPEGYYYLETEAPGYIHSIGTPFEVRGNEIHTNIELRTQFWLIKVADWRTILLVLAFIMLIYHFLEDRKRRKIETELLAQISHEGENNGIINKE